MSAKRTFTPEIHSECGLLIKRPGPNQPQYKCLLLSEGQVHIDKCSFLKNTCHCNNPTLKWNSALQKYEAVASNSPPMPALSLPNSVLAPTPVANVPQDMASLYRELGSLQAQNAMLTAENETLKKDNSYLREKINKLYGKINFLKSGKSGNNNNNAAHKTVANPESKPIKKLNPAAQGPKKPFRKNWNKPGTVSDNEVNTEPKTDL